MGITLNFNFAIITICDRYMIAEVQEGVVLSHEHHDVLELIAETYYHNTAFVYISHRIHSYAVDPMIYIRTSKLENLVGFAYVSQYKLPLTNAQLEKAFLKKPNFMGRKLEDAIEWAEKLTEKKLQVVLT